MKYEEEEEDKMRINTAKASIDLYYGGTNVWVNQRNGSMINKSIVREGIQTQQYT